MNLYIRVSYEGHRLLFVYIARSIKTVVPADVRLFTEELKRPAQTRDLFDDNIARTFRSHVYAIENKKKKNNAYGLRDIYF